MDGDGYDDVLLSHSSTSALLLNARNDTFVDATQRLFPGTIPTASYRSPLLSDFTNDGKLDVVVMASGAFLGPPGEWLQQDNGSFVEVPLAQTGILNVHGRGMSVAADFDLDGNIDIVCSGQTSLSRPIRRFDGLGNGSFVMSTPPDLVTNTENTWVSFSLAHDVDRDGYPDLIYSEDWSPNYFLKVAFGSPTDLTGVQLLETGSYGPQVAIDIDDRTFVLSPRQTSTTALSGQSPVYAAIVQNRSVSKLGSEVFLADSGVTGLQPYDLGKMMAQDMALGDFISGDGCLDVAFCGLGATFECGVLAGRCDGELTDASADVLLTALFGIKGFLSADFDRDGHEDLLYWGNAVGGAKNSQTAVYHMTSRGFSINQGPALVDAVISVFQFSSTSIGDTKKQAIADVNGDGAPDVMVLTPNGDGYVTFLINLGNGTFVNASGAATLGARLDSTTRISVASWGDLTNEGRDSMLWISETSTDTCVYANLGNATLACARDVLPSSAPFLSPLNSARLQALVADLDGDGRVDLLVVGSNVGSDMTLLAHGAENNTLVAAPREAVPLSLVVPVAIAAIDLDHAGGMDVLLTSSAYGSSDYTLQALLGEASGVLVAADAFVSGYDNNGAKLVVGDLDGDTWDDVIVSGRHSTECVQPPVLLRAKAVVGGSTTSTTGAAGAGAESSDGSPLAGILGGAVGGAALLALVACGACCFVVCCGALVCVALVALVAVVVVAVVVVGVVAVGGAGATMAGTGGGAALALTRRRKAPGDEEEPAESLDEVKRRMKGTSDYKRLRWGELEFGRKIGEGAYGSVFAGQWQGVKVAIKVLRGEALTPAALCDFGQEALMMAKVSHHPHIVTFVGAVIEEEHLALVTHFAANGSLDALVEKGALGETERRRVTAECAAGVAFLHSQGIVHRDLAARNVLLDAGMHAQIADFGYSRVLEDGVDAQNTKSDVGPIRWMAPEAISNREYSPASDAWAFGMLMYEIWHEGRMPYDNIASLADVAIAVSREQATPEIGDDVPADIAALMQQLWEYDPRFRPTLTAAHAQLATASQASAMALPD